MSLRARLLIQVMFAAAAAAHAATALADGNAERGKVLAYTCLGCHGIDNYKNVYPTYSVPELGGQHAAYIVAALKEYKNGERSHATMHEQAASLSDQDMQDIAAYFSGPELKAGTTTVGTPPPQVAQLCAACHGKDGIGITGDYPTLAGQHADYLERALEEYKKGDRKNAVMPTFMGNLSAEQIAELADYYSEQRPPLHTVRRRLSILSAQ
jgi:cytochrome c553